MARIKKIQAIKSTTKVKNKNPILNHKLQKKELDKSLSKKVETQKTALTIREHGKAIKHYLSYYKTGINLKNALDKSLKIDIDRAKLQLKAFYIKTITKDVFKFTVKASGLYQATSHEVHIKWETDGLIGIGRSHQEIFYNAPIKIQCSCGRFTYWYRYILTIAKSALGKQEHRFPSIRNKNLEGLCCKHLIVTMKGLERSTFKDTAFKRYIENLENNKRTRISSKDKAKIAGSSFSSK